MLTCSLLLSERDIDCRGLSGKHHGNTFALTFLHSTCRMGVEGAAAINTYILSYPLHPFFESQKILASEVKLKDWGGGESRRFIVYPFPAIESWYTTGANTVVGSAQAKKISSWSAKLKEISLLKAVCPAHQKDFRALILCSQYAGGLMAPIVCPALPIDVIEIAVRSRNVQFLNTNTWPCSPLAFGQPWAEENLNYMLSTLQC